MKCEPWLKKSWYTVHLGVRGLFNVDFSKETDWSAQSHALALKEVGTPYTQAILPNKHFSTENALACTEPCPGLKKSWYTVHLGPGIEKVGTPGIARCTNFKLISRCTNELW